MSCANRNIQLVKNKKKKKTESCFFPEAVFAYPLGITHAGDPCMSARSYWLCSFVMIRRIDYTLSGSNSDLEKSLSVL